MKAPWHRLLLPPLVVTLVLLQGTQAVFLHASFYRDMGFGVQAETWSLANYARMLGDPFHGGVLWNSPADGGGDRGKPAFSPAPASVARMTGRLLSALLMGFVAIYLAAPLVVVIGGSFSAPETGGLLISYVEFPPKKLTLDWYRAITAATYRGLGLAILPGIQPGHPRLRHHRHPAFGRDAVRRAPYRRPRRLAEIAILRRKTMAARISRRAFAALPMVALAERAAAQGRFAGATLRIGTFGGTNGETIRAAVGERFAATGASRRWMPSKSSARRCRR